jgi:hypothetical protein
MAIFEILVIWFGISIFVGVLLGHAIHLMNKGPGHNPKQHYSGRSPLATLLQ